MRRIWIIIIAMIAVLPGMSQTPEQPSAAFQSTSTMPSSGSAYSSSPMINPDGTATYVGASPAPAKVHIGNIRKSGAFDDDDEDMPLPDALLPLLLFALGYGLFFLPKKSRQTTKKKI